MAMVLVTDENGNIEGKENLWPDYFELADNAGMEEDTAPGRTIGSYGGKGGKLCCADHIHPHTDAWKNDPAINLMRKDIADLAAVFSQKQAENMNEFTINFVEIVEKIVELAMIIIEWSAQVGLAVAPYVINALIRALNRAMDINIKEIEIDGERISLSEVIEKLKEI